MSDSSAAETGRTALRVAAVVLLVLVVAPFVVTGVPAVVGAEESFVVLSGSMDAEPEPIIKPGDVVIVDGVNPATLEEQDIITFTAGGDEPVTHRIVNVTEEDGQVAFRTKGDANEDADQQLVGPDQVIGEVMLVIPLIGHVVNFANTTQGFVLLVLLPIGLLVLSEAWNLVASRDDSPEEASGEPGTFDRSPPMGAAGATATATATATTTEVEADADGDEDGPSTISLGRTQVGGIAVGLVPIAAATGYVAFRLQEAWILTAFFASVGLFVLSTLLYLRIRWGSSDPEAPAGSPRPAGHPVGPVEGSNGGEVGHGDGETAMTAVTTARPVVEDGIRQDPVVNGRIEGVDTRSLVEVSVDSREELVGMAIEKGTWVVHDTDVGAYVLVDDGMLFRYDDGDGSGPDRPAVEPASEWEEASGWVTFPDDENEDEGEGEGDTAADQADGSAVEVHSDDPDDTAGTTGWELAPADTGRVPSSDGNGDEPTSLWSEEGLTPAVRRVDGDEELTPAIRRVDGDEDATGGTADGPTRSDGVDEVTTDGSVRTDGGTTAGPSSSVRGTRWLVGLPVRALGFVGYLAIEPPMALYRTLRPDGPESESSPRTDGRSEGEP
jgi:signal peptidase